jgi:hypothetical protein
MLTLADCGPLFLCTRESLEDMIGRHNELVRERDEARIAYAVVVDAMVVEQSAYRETRNQCDNLADLLRMIRNEYAEWRVQPECDCDDCLLLGPIDEALATLNRKEES